MVVVPVRRQRGFGRDPRLPHLEHQLAPRAPAFAVANDRAVSGRAVGFVVRPDGHRFRVSVLQNLEHETVIPGQPDRVKIAAASQFFVTPSARQRTRQQFVDDGGKLPLHPRREPFDLAPERSGRFLERRNFRDRDIHEVTRPSAKRPVPRLR